MSLADMTGRELGALLAEKKVTELNMWCEGGIWGVAVGIAGRVHEGSSRESGVAALEVALRVAEVL